MVNMISEELEELSKTSMQIILFAGDAKEAARLAFDAILKADLVEYEKNMDLAEKNLTNAHKLQTKVLQQESNGEKIIHSYLFSHAQDTLMTIKSEKEMIELMVKLYLSVKEGKLNEIR